MPRESVPTPVENKGSKPCRIYADLYGDPNSHSHHPVLEAMSPVLVCVSPGLPLAEVKKLILRQRLPGVPVVADDQEILGVVTWADLASLPPESTAAQAMHHALALPVWTPIGKAAAIMSSENIEVAAVVDFNRRVQGVLTALDIVRWLACEDGYVLSRPTE